MSNIIADKLLFAGLASVLVFLLRGVSGLTISWVLLATGISLIKRQNRIVFISITLAGISLITGDVNDGAAFILVGALVGIAGSSELPSRAVFCASLSVILLDGSLTGIFPVFIGSLLSLLFIRIRWRILALTAGIIVGLSISGIPRASEYRILVTEEKLEESSVIWPDPVSVTFNHPKVHLEAENIDGAEMVIEISAGGVRDSSPVGRIETAGRTYSIPPGSGTIRIERAGFPVRVILDREWKPFTHPVIWIQNAVATP